MASRRSWLRRTRVLLGGALLALVVAIGAVLIFAPDGGDEPSNSSAEPPDGSTVVYAVGDGADGSDRADDLAEYIEAEDPDRFLYLGDVYMTGTPGEFERHYEPIYGELADRTDPVIGNHEYLNRERGYYRYWIEQRGWDREQAKHRAYVDEASGWQIIAYSSETDMEAEADWVAAQMDSHEGTCRIALAHKGRHVIADEDHSDNPEQEPVWRVLAGRTAINLVAHSHVYGLTEPIDGVNVIVSGTGGHDLGTLGDQHHSLVEAGAGSPSATRLVLRPGSADIAQVDADGTAHYREIVRCKRAAD